MPDASHLEPWRWRPGQSGNPDGVPAWRRALLETVGDGELYWRLLSVIAMGAEVSIEIRARVNKRGKLELEFLEEPRKVVPMMSHMLRATEMLLDRSFGKAVQAIITQDVSEPGTRKAGREILEALDQEDRQALKRIAQKIALRGDSGSPRPDRGGDSRDHGP